MNKQNQFIQKKKECKSILEFFQLFLTEKDVEQICKNTNRRVKQKMKQNVIGFSQHNSWTKLTPSEVYKYFSIILYQHYYKIPLKQMWSQTPKRFG